MNIVDYATKRIEGATGESLFAIIEEILELCPELDELEVAKTLDEHFFTCIQCDWTMPIEDISEDCEDELICEDCVI